MGDTDTNSEDAGDRGEDSGGTPLLGDELSTQGDLCTRPRKRRRLLRSENEVVWGESGLSRQGGGQQELLCSEGGVDVSEEETDLSDSSDESLSEDEEVGRFCNNAYRWGVAFRGDPISGWTDAQWVAYWRERGYFLTPGEPFATPFKLN